MSPEQKKEWPCVFHYTKEGGCLKGKDCQNTHNPKHKHKLDNDKARAKAAAKQQGLLCRRGTGSATPAKQQLQQL